MFSYQRADILDGEATMQGKQAKSVSPTQERAMLGSLGTTRYPARDRVMFLLSLKASCHLQKSCSTTSEILYTHVQKWCSTRMPRGTPPMGSLPDSACVKPRVSCSKQALLCMSVGEDVFWSVRHALNRSRGKCMTKRRVQHAGNTGGLVNTSSANDRLLRCRNGRLRNSF